MRQRLRIRLAAAICAALVALALVAPSVGAYHSGYCGYGNSGWSFYNAGWARDSYVGNDAGGRLVMVHDHTAWNGYRTLHYYSCYP